MVGLSKAASSTENSALRESFVDLTERGVRAAVKLTAEAAADETGIEESMSGSSDDSSLPKTGDSHDVFESVSFNIGVRND